MRFENMPMPPSINQCYAQVGRRRIKSAKLVSFNLEMDAWAILRSSSIRRASKSLEGLKLRLDLTFSFPKGKIICKDGSSRKLDVSNRIKAIEDAFCRLLEIDDSNIFEIRAIKAVGTCEKVALEIGEYVAV